MTDQTPGLRQSCLSTMHMGENRPKSSSIRMMNLQLFTRHRGSRWLRGGITHTLYLGKSGPWEHNECCRKDCMMCLAGESVDSQEKLPDRKGEDNSNRKKGMCGKECLICKITCQGCKKNNIKVEYYRETSRTAYIRGQGECQGERERC